MRTTHHFHLSQIRSELSSFGWVHLKGFFSEAIPESLLQFAKEFGEAAATRRDGPIIDTLKPTLPEHAHNNSLSKQHGFDAFPFHTDTAHWHRPARMIMLACNHPGETRAQTLLHSFNELNLCNQTIMDLVKGVFLVTNGRNSFYTGVISQDESMIRFDPGCMTPQTASARNGWQNLHSRIQDSTPHAIDWNRGDLLIIDNWRVLHARSAVSNETKRELFRVTLIEQPADEN